MMGGHYNLVVAGGIYSLKTKVHLSCFAKFICPLLLSYFCTSFSMKRSKDRATVLHDPILFVTFTPLGP
jgi:hypothetical protein